MMMVSISKKAETTRLPTCIGLEGVEKKRIATRRLPRVRVVYEKSKKPEPRECIMGGLTKMETRSSTHQRKVIMAKRTEK